MKLLRSVLRYSAPLLFKSLAIMVAMLAFWIGAAYAYTGTGLFVNGYGNIGSAYFSKSGDYREARTYTSNSIYYQAVNARHWHFSLEWEVNRETYNGSTTTLASFSSGTYGADAAQHAFYGAPGTGFNYYYTSPTGSSSYSVWATGQ